jgi:hypothetical protein
MTTNDPADSAARLVAWTPLRNLTDFVRVTTDSWRLAAENNTLLKRLETAMADVSGLLNEVADGLRGPLATSITALLAERDQPRRAQTLRAGGHGGRPVRCGGRRAGGVRRRGREVRARSPRCRTSTRCPSPRRSRRRARSLRADRRTPQQPPVLSWLRQGGRCFANCRSPQTSPGLTASPDRGAPAALTPPSGGAPIAGLAARTPTLRRGSAPHHLHQLWLM